MNSTAILLYAIRILLGLVMYGMIGGIVDVGYRRFFRVELKDNALSDPRFWVVIGWPIVLILAIVLGAASITALALSDREKGGDDDGAA